MDYKIQTSYNAKVLIETAVDINGQSYLIIYGEHVNGNFCCIPGYGWGCEMAEPSDVFYNRDKLMTECGITLPIADAIANSIKEKSERELTAQVKSDTNQNKLSVLYIEPNKPPRKIEIVDSLEAMQALVGGNIEVYYPFSDNAVIVCNEEGKVKGLPLNRAIYDEKHREVQEIIAGSFFICYAPPESENFLSLPSELEKRYSKMFKYPERFYQTANGIKVESTKPPRTDPELI